MFILMLYPFQALGLHSHGAEEEHSDHGHTATEPEFVLGKMLTVVASIYAFFLFEKGLAVLFGKSGLQHSHSHGQSPHKVGPSDDEKDQVIKVFLQWRIFMLRHIK